MNYILSEEGGYEENNDDNGGEKNMGIKINKL